MERSRQGQKRRVDISEKGEDQDDIRIGGGVANIRLTPRVVLLIVLLAVIGSPRRGYTRRPVLERERVHYAPDHDRELASGRFVRDRRT